MALRAVIEHPKFARLRSRLGLPRYATLGVLEAMWHFCGRFTPRGNIGKYTDEDIEAWVEWAGEPGALIKALVDCRWIDRNDEHRLVVHDWHIHADDAAKLAVKRSGLELVVPTVSGHCRDTVGETPTESGLPVPVPEPEKEVIPNCQLGSESGDGGVGEEGSEMVARLAAKSKLRLAVERLVEETEDDDDDASGGDSLSEKRGNDFRKIGDFRNGGNSRVSSTLREMDERDELERQRAALRRG